MSNVIDLKNILILVFFGLVLLYLKLVIGV